ncbi:hypothetical protein [Nocardia cyriacigeorgica]|uniref:Uncharacterized protein n=1 Tax=Nocardia cyriacigeorgica TaxID=135487 RepID=A0A4V6ICS7_9NOCA|nr:hypothetical protein [Nocardia cyriacigeorgica]MBF6099110.1 hypothetical protein [Nocardia cyriacigeorgica]MBF6315699.1 hypothetical protein [Nocardia cyriacigeorgica]MBF6530484.1 hypothetical protein [Nocardia cyriacigeorgica]VFB00384.1 Uncharacterised protein [Nocardia cyriacigeorgica]
MSTQLATIVNPSIELIELAGQVSADASVISSAALRSHLAPSGAAKKGNFNSFIEADAAHRGNFNSFIDNKGNFMSFI